MQIFFENAPTGMDMAFVVIIHLSAEHVSHVDEILGRTTGMPVRQVTATMPIEKNHIYVIAPGKQMEMADGCLRISDREVTDRPALTIDHFFLTLADAHGANSIGIVPSGAGSDGAAGLSRIKEMGGITLAQSPGDAEYAEMPQHAIDTQQVDIVLPVAELPQRLLELSSNAQQIHLQDLQALDTAHDRQRGGAGSPERALTDILMHLRVRTGHDFRPYKRATVLAHRAAHAGQRPAGTRRLP